MGKTQLSCFRLLAIIAALMPLGIGGCALSRNPVPIAQMPNADLVSIKAVRSWGGEYSPHFQKDLVESIRQEKEGDFPRNPDGSLAYKALAISGGGASGAFGAGFLCGWTDAGTRPEFKLVTGISTGALIAPYAFLGPDYDDQLKKAFTTITTKDIFDVRGIISLLWSESFGDTAPLQKFIEREFDEEILKAIADRHARGYRLYIGTTNIDADRFVVWNMGAIASSGHPDALKLMHKVLLASASIPGAFPPVYFNVEVDGKQYDEMHVDGGTITQVFFYGFILDLPAARREIFGKDAPKPGGSIYVIRNGKIGPTPEPVRRFLLNIIEKSLSTTIRAHGFGDLYRIYAITQRDQIDFNYVGIPDEYVPEGKEMFDPKEMNRLLDLGFEMARSGYKWHMVPPGLGENN